jgi:hypothetical protein
MRPPLATPPNLFDPSAISQGNAKRRFAFGKLVR